MAYLRIKTGQLISANGMLFRYLFDDYGEAWHGASDVICLKESPLAQLIGLFFRFLNYIRMPLLRYEAKIFGLKDGALIPKTYLSYYIGQLFVLARCRGIKVDRFAI